MTILRLSPNMIPSSAPRWTSVAGLFGFRCPAAVDRVVVAVVIDSIKGVFRRWAWPHVTQKRLERVSPLVAHLDPTSTPLRKVGRFGIIAAVLHSFPCVVFTGTTQTVSAVSFLGSLKAQTATGENLLPEITHTRNGFIAAITDAIPTGMLRVITWGLSQRDESAKSLTSNISFSHRSNIGKGDWCGHHILNKQMLTLRVTITGAGMVRASELLFPEGLS